MNKTAFLVLWSLLALVKLVLAVTLPLFGDEAFYAWEGRHLAWSYSDLPPMTAWLTALGASVLPGAFGLRVPFLALGLLLPWQVVALARHGYGSEAGWRAGCLALLLPLAATLGVLALPDVPLLVLTVAAVTALTRALDGDARSRAWWLLGAALGLGLLTHYRFAALPLVIAIVLLARPEGRAALRSRGPWLAAAVAALGLLPLLWFNFGNELAGLRFQLLDRHPWSWHGRGWQQIVEQMLVASPILLGLLFWAAWKVLSRPRWVSKPNPVAPGQSSSLALEVRQHWPVSIAVALWALFLVLGFVADPDRFRWHWPLSAFVLLLPALAAHWMTLRTWLRRLALTLAVAFSAMVFAYLGLASQPDRAARLLDGKAFPSNFSGWRESAHWLTQAGPMPERLVADNFMLAATLRFYLPESWAPGVRVLDDALNRRHGRAAQLHIWALDETALAADPNRSGWIVADESARRFSDRWPWYQGLCARFSGLELVDQLWLFGGNKRFVLWRFDRYEPRPSCVRPEAVPPLGWVDTPGRVRRGEPLEVFGWVVQTGLGIDTVEVLWNDEVVARPERTIEIDWVEQRWGEVGDPAGQRIGFRAVLDTTDQAPGSHRLSVRVRRADGRVWPLSEQQVRLR